MSYISFLFLHDAGLTEFRLRIGLTETMKKSVPTHHLLKNAKTFKTEELYPY